jgi:hypothetical protein
MGYSVAGKKSKDISEEHVVSMFRVEEQAK